MDVALREALDAELAAIRADPLAAVGFGEKAYLPYSTVLGHGLISVTDPEVTGMLAAAIAAAPDPVVALALLHVLGQREGDGVDAVLLRALASPSLRATAAYLLGRIGYRGYPDRRRDTTAVVAGLRPYLDDAGEFTDPFLHKTFQRRDFVIAALIRLLGVERFTGIDERRAPMIGLALPEFGDAERAHLVSELERMG